MRALHTLVRRDAAALLATLGVLVGLFGMHVLGLHGTQDAAGTAAATSQHSHEATDHHAEAAAHEHGAAPLTPVASATILAQDCCDHGPHAGMLMLCLGLIVASVILMLLRSLTLGLAPRRPGLPRLAFRRPIPTARAGPPYLMAFSVIRC